MRCKICSAPTERFYDEIMQSDFFHCKPCEFIFKDDAKIVTRERELAQYNNHNNSFESSGYVEMFRDFIAKCVTPHKADISTALEFGCGPGPVLAKLLEDEGFTVDRYDKFFHPEPVYADKRYDLITSTEVIEHIADPMETIKLFHNHLRPGGHLALMTQFHTNNPDDFLKWWYRKDPTHITFFRPATFGVIAEKLGFELLYADEKKVLVLQKLP